ncbi:hypothetical protein [Streptomyces sp. NPDC018031]|uniref:hypothetical protein n=1 Tax=Streptomyces sp. NPDC018031 TaxID=3365033 RepID=UPI003790471D
MTTTPQPPDEPSLPDDVWEKFEHDTLASIRATAPKEPSARARMVTARFREEEEQAAIRGAERMRSGPKPSYRTRRRTEKVRRELRTEPERPVWRGHERRRHRGFLDRWRLPIVIVLTLAVGALVLNPLGVLSPLLGIGDSADDGPRAAAPPEPGDEPTGPASPAGSSPVTSDRAFPDRTVRLRSGTEHRRLTTATTDDCRRAVSPNLAALIAEGKGCLQVTSALYTDRDRAQFTVSVLTFRRADDLAAVLAKASTDPVGHQVLPLAPPTGSGLARLTAETPGVFQGGTTARSVVIATGRPSDGRAGDTESLSRDGGELLAYVRENVAAHERGEGARQEEPTTQV